MVLESARETDLDQDEAGPCWGGYAAVLAFAANEFYEQYVYELNHAADVAAYSGMFAGGDLLLELFVLFLLMIPTFFLWSGSAQSSRRPTPSIRKPS